MGQTGWQASVPRVTTQLYHDQMEVPGLSFPAGKMPDPTRARAAQPPSVERPPQSLTRHRLGTPSVPGPSGLSQDSSERGFLVIQRLGTEGSAGQRAVPGGATEGPLRFQRSRDGRAQECSQAGRGQLGTIRPRKGEGIRVWQGLLLGTRAGGGAPVQAGKTRPCCPAAAPGEAKTPTGAWPPLGLGEWGTRGAWNSRPLSLSGLRCDLGRPEDTAPGRWGWPGCHSPGDGSRARGPARAPLGSPENPSSRPSHGQGHLCQVVLKVRTGPACSRCTRDANVTTGGGRPSTESPPLAWVPQPHPTWGHPQLGWPISSLNRHSPRASPGLCRDPEGHTPALSASRCPHTPEGDGALSPSPE